MKANVSIFVLSALISWNAFAVDISDITNSAAWTQTHHTETYTVGADGQSLLHNRKDTGMKLKTVAKAGDKISVTDTSIPVKPRAPKPTGGGTGETGAGAAGAGAGAGGSGSGSSGAGTGAGAGASAATKPTVKAHIKGMSTGAKVAGALGAVAGAATIYDATSGQQQHSGWDVAQGAGGGAMAGASIGSFFPGLGTAIGAAVGAVVGGVIAGSQLFSETDCLTDPVTGKFTCCHTAFNKGQRYADIGDYMFCVVDAVDGVPAQYGTRQCQQGGSATAYSWWDGLWQDDAWTPECEYRYCNNDAPKLGFDNYIVHTADTENFCWKWQCADGLVRVGNWCERSTAGAAGGVATGNDDSTETEPVITDTSNERYELAIAKIQAQRNRVIRMCGGNNTASTSTDTSNKTSKNNKK